MMMMTATAMTTVWRSSCSELQLNRGADVGKSGGGDGGVADGTGVD